MQGRHDSYVWAVACSQEGRLVASAGDDGVVKVWDAETGKLVAQCDTFRQAESAFHFEDAIEKRIGATAVRFGVDTLLFAGKPLASASFAWRQNHIHRLFGFHRDWTWSIDVSYGDHLVATASRDRTVCLWNRGMGRQPLFVLDTHTGPVLEVRFAPREREIVTASRDRTAEVWTVTQTIGFNTGSPMNYAEFSPTDPQRLVTAGDDGLVRVTDRWRRLFRNLFLGSPARYAAFSPDGQTVVTTDAKGGVRLWNAERQGEPGKEPPLRAFVGHNQKKTVNTARFSPDGKRLVTAGDDFTVRVWDVASGKEIYQRLWGGARFLSAQFSPDGHQIAAAASDGAVYLLDPAQPNRGNNEDILAVMTAPGHRYVAQADRYPRDVAFSPNGRFVASADNNGRIYVFEIGTQFLRATLDSESGSVSSVHFSPDGQRIVGACDDNTVRLWRLADAFEAQRREERAPPYLTLRSHVARVASARFSPDGEEIVTASDDGTSRLFPATARAHVRRARQILALRSAPTTRPPQEILRARR